MVVRLFILILLMNLAACAQYKAKPLDLEAHRAAWAQRDPAAALSTFASRLGAPVSAPEVYDPGDGLSLAEAEIVALVFNPELRVARARADVAQAVAQHAGLWEDPVFSVDLLRIVESVPEPWFLGAGVGFTIPISGRLAAEKGQATSNYHAAIARAAQREWELLSELRSTWLEWSSVTLQAQVVSELVERLNRIVGMVDRLEQAGEIPRIESRLFSIESAKRSNDAKSLRARAVELELALKALLGLRPESPVAFEPSLTLSAPSLEFDARERMVEINNPSLAVARAEYQLAEQTLEREVRKQYPDLNIGPAYENEDDQSRIGIGAWIPIPILNRNKQGIAEAQAQRGAMRAAFEAQYEALVQHLAQAELEVHSRQELRQDLESNLIPLVEAQVQDAQRMIDLGELNTLVQLESIIGRAEAKLKLVEARRAEARAVNRLRTLLGPETNINPSTMDANP